MPARLGGERRRREPVADCFEYFLDAGLDDAYERGTRNKLRRFPLIVPDRRYGDHIALVRPAGEHTAIQRLDSLGVGDARIEAAGQIRGHVPAAQREAVGVDKTPPGK